MKLSIGTCAFISTLLSQTVAAAAIHSPPKSLQAKAEHFAASMHKCQNVDWQFNLYQNARCTGASDPYSGTGTTVCMRGIRNGGAAASTKSFVDPDCTVLLFSDANCTSANVIDGIDKTTPTGCRTPQVAGSIRSWAVHCP
ncbi:hypothetical protein BDV29DRAFT_173689 [Aspergillus leporis]|uniref:Uncharacterized protein n=1 Tax=Aspergillus leporis TaxID=41062 RepID=A0A5N5X4H6_9EURO|nr:hypothetical protein BDV29DRAFT_173689 [Aspergillus leporis]